MKEDVDLHTSPEVNHRWEGGKKKHKGKLNIARTHTLWYSRFPSVPFLMVVFCVKPCVISLACQRQSNLKDSSNKPVLASAIAPASPATVAVWPMTSSLGHSGRVIKEKGLETVCQRGKVSENVSSR